LGGVDFLKILFVHHEFHDISKSSNFVIELITKLGHEVQIRKRTDSAIWLREPSPDLYILWQAERLLPEVTKFGVPVICIPMLDDALPLKVDDFSTFHSVHFISFSKTLHKFLLLSGCNSSFIRYWPKPPLEDSEKNESIFFWERNPSHLNIENVVGMTEQSKIPIFARKLPDPHDLSGAIPTELNSRVTLIEPDWITKEKYSELIAQNQVFVSPRPWEGIGLSFLEAMANGSCVIAFNNPTMNEYIKSGSNGVLINSRTEKVDLSRMFDIGINARKSALVGYVKFESTAIDFFTTVIMSALDKRNTHRIKLLPGQLTLRRFIFLITLRR